MRRLDFCRQQKLTPFVRRIGQPYQRGPGVMLVNGWFGIYYQTRTALYQTAIRFKAPFFFAERELS